MDYIANAGPLPEHDLFDADYRLPRITSDRGTHKYGDLLIDMCKSTHMRIVNGRHGKDHFLGQHMLYSQWCEHGRLFNHFYVNFKLVDDVSVCGFSMYSNHATIIFQFRIKYMSNMQPTESIHYK